MNDDINPAVDRWIDQLTPTELREFARSFGVEVDSDEFYGMMRSLLIEHLQLDPFERDTYPGVPK